MDARIKANEPIRVLLGAAFDGTLTDAQVEKLAAIGQRKEQRLECCPCCGGEFQRCRRTRTIENILEDLRTVVTEHMVH